MAPDISKIDTDRYPDPGTPAWNFRDKVIRRLLHGKQSLPSGGPAHPIYQDQSYLRLYTAEVMPKVCLFRQILGAQEGTENTKMVNATASGQPHPAAGVSMSALLCGC